MARETAGVLDGSPLGKIEVIGPNAEAFVNFMFYNTMKTLKVGHIRYGFLLTEGGIVYDDGVVARLAPDRFLISCSSSHVDGVRGLLETWRQDGNTLIATPHLKDNAVSVIDLGSGTEDAHMVSVAEALAPQLLHVLQGRAQASA